jgi:hypothetical protein
MSRRAIAWFLPLAFILVGQLGAQPKDDTEELPAIFKGKPIPPAAGDDELRKLLKERYNAAVAELGGRYQMFLAGRGTFDSLFDGARRVVHAGLELHDKPADQIALLTGYVELARKIEKINQARDEAGRIMRQELDYARYMRADAEIQLLRAKKAAAGK